MLTQIKPVALVPAEIRGCRLCDHSRVSVDGADAALVCVRGRVVGYHGGELACVKARSLQGECGPEAKFLRFPGLEVL